MTVEWQGDHRALTSEVRAAFEQEAGRLGLGTLIVEVVRDTGAESSSKDPRFTIYITDLVHTDRETVKLHAGDGHAWVKEFAKLMGHRGGGAH